MKERRIQLHHMLADSSIRTFRDFASNCVILSEVGCVNLIHRSCMCRSLAETQCCESGYFAQRELKNLLLFFLLIADLAIRNWYPSGWDLLDWLTWWQGFQRAVHWVFHDPCCHRLRLCSKVLLRCGSMNVLFITVHLKNVPPVTDSCH